MKNNDFLTLVKKRFSCRAYLEKEVTDEDIAYCLEAARNAPSSCNKQPWRYIVVKDKILKSSIAEKCLLPGLKMKWIQDAPVIIIACAQTSFVTHKLASLLSKNNYYQIDIGISGEHFVLAASSLGLATCWIGWYKERKIKRLLNIPRRVKVLSLITLGHPKCEKTSASKLSLNKISFIEKWGNNGYE